MAEIYLVINSEIKETVNLDFIPRRNENFIYLRENYRVTDIKHSIIVIKNDQAKGGQVTLQTIKIYLV